MENTNKKIVDGRYQLGIVSDWILKQDINPQEYWVYMVIARASLNQYHKKTINIKLDDFKMNKNTLKKYRDSLVTKGFIDWKNTKAYTCYWLKEPNSIIRDFVFKDSKVKENKKPKIEIF